MRLLSLPLVLVVLIGCAHTNEGEGPPAGGPPPEDNSPVVTPAEVAWKDMTKQQKGRYMHHVVMPKMKDVFVAFDAEKFAKPNCNTCHGKNPKEHGFKMPSPDLPQLPASEKEFMETVMKDKPEMVKFMSGKVTPMMADLLGLKAFDPKAPDPAAFGCHACHTLKGAPQASN